MATHNIQFTGTDGQQLVGRLETPPTKPRAYALFAHCFTCTKNIRAATNISGALADAGFAVLRFDFTGLGESEGDFADTNFSSNVEDLVAAADFMARELEPPSLLVGHSLGGTAVLQAASSVPSSKAVAVIGSPFEPAHVAKHLLPAREEIESLGEAEVMLAGRPFRIKKQFLDDLSRHDLKDTIRRLRKALIVFHSPVDETVSIDNASAIFGHALHPKSFVSLDAADHLLMRPEDSRYVGRVLAAWAERYLATPPETKTLDAGEGEVVAQTRIDSFHTPVAAGPHMLVADEPAGVGGTDTGPSPYGLLSAALASCTSMTLKMYAQHKNLPMEAVTVRVDHNKIHAKDCEECESTSGRVDRFDRVIELEGPLDDAQRQRMLEIADKCPVHRTLEGEVLIKSALAD